MENKVVDAYIDELQGFLKPLNAAERDDVLEFYREYIIDAKLDTNDKIINELGSPKHLARRVLADYSIKMSEQNYQEIDDGKISDNEKMKKNAGMIWIIILALLASPIAIPVAIALILAVVLFVGLAVTFTLLFIFLVALSVVGGIGAIVVGIAVIFQSFTTTLFYVGAGLAILGVDLILIPLIISFCRWVWDVIVMFFRWIGKKLIHGRKTPVKEGKENA
ncbi:DUF1700 domain-containing protein [Companilactobacillus ginsenosidimutans]|uniref:DUF1700 domain-containing protein n=1 Tax=Companilactobacillus ginsenosidimutans TaxID=1007676 RepID=A0A0H4R092_9LACO|nr:DUF1700 domain-containing protein [Companilactobacillus ginsenosidimutans]AKP67130.1 hypothetical protein ABM34_05990 [Companilactobacillus ginsenosidimutans]